MSMALNKSLTTATISAPAAMTCGIADGDAANGGNRPGEAATGFASNSGVAASAAGLVAEEHAAYAHVVGADLGRRGDALQVVVAQETPSRRSRGPRAPSGDRVPARRPNRHGRHRRRFPMASQRSSLTISLAP